MNDTYKKRKKEYLDNTKNSSNHGMKFTTVSGEPVDLFYGPDDIENINYLAEI